MLSCKNFTYLVGDAHFHTREKHPISVSGYFQKEGQKLRSFESPQYRLNNANALNLKSPNSQSIYLTLIDRNLGKRE